MAYKKKPFVQNPGNNAICYYRYSSKAQRDVSIDQQRDAAKEYAKARGYHILREYKDEARSGTTTEGREDYQKMLREVETLKPAVLILWKTDRLSRDRVDSTIAKKRLRDCGVKIEYIAETLPDDDAAAALIESIYEAMAEMYIIGHRQNVSRGLQSNAKKALYNGRLILGYVGKKDEQYKIDDNTAPIVRKIFSDYADGKPMQQICNELKSAGIKTVRGNDFCINSLHRILTNRAYLGEYRWGDIFLEDGMPRIIDDETFEKVQSRLEQNKRGGKGALRHDKSSGVQNFWLTKHIVCKECGGTLQGVSGTGKSGKLHYYYSCQNHRRHKCSLKNQRKDLLEDIISYVLDDLMNDSAIRLLIAERCYAYYLSQNDMGDSLEKAIKERIKDVDKKLDNYLKAIEGGVFNKTTQQRMEELEEQRSLLTDELIAEQNRQQCKLTLTQIVRWLDTFVKDFSKEELLDYMVEKIYVSNDKLTVVFYFTDDTRELPYKETIEMLEERKKPPQPAEPSPEYEERMRIMLESVINPESGGENVKKKGRRKKKGASDSF